MLQGAGCREFPAAGFRGSLPVLTRWGVVRLREAGAQRAGGFLFNFPTTLVLITSLSMAKNQGGG